MHACECAVRIVLPCTDRLVERVPSAERSGKGEDAAAVGLENSEAATQHSKVR